MESLNKTKLAIAAGVTSGIFYLGCALIMLLTGKDGIVKVSNALFHGMDFQQLSEQICRHWSLCLAWWGLCC